MIIDWKTHYCKHVNFPKILNIFSEILIKVPAGVCVCVCVCVCVYRLILKSDSKVWKYKEARIINTLLKRSNNKAGRPSCQKPRMTIKL